MAMFYFWNIDLLDSNSFYQAKALWNSEGIVKRISDAGVNYGNRTAYCHTRLENDRYAYTYVYPTGHIDFALAFAHGWLTAAEANGDKVEWKIA